MKQRRTTSLLSSCLQIALCATLAGACGDDIQPDDGNLVDAAMTDAPAPTDGRFDGRTGDGPSGDGPAGDGPAGDGPVGDTARDGAMGDGPAVDGSVVDGGVDATPDAETVRPVVQVTVPAPGGTAIPLNARVVATFSEAMDPATVTTTSMLLTGPSSTPVAGTVQLVGGRVATFSPTADLASGTLYTATIKASAADVVGNQLGTDFVWSFTTSIIPARGPAPVNLRSAANYVILSKTGISTTPGTTIVGNIGVSPAAETAITGFDPLARDPATGQFSTSALVPGGRIESATHQAPTPANLTTAIGDLEAAFTEAAGRTLPDFTEHRAGNISGETLAPGLYKWSTGVLVNTNVVLNGGPNDVWIFQIAQDLALANGVEIQLAPGARASNVFWQVAGQVTVGTTAKMKGNILSQTQIVMRTGASLEGRALAQTAVTLDANMVTAPLLP